MYEPSTSLIAVPGSAAATTKGSRAVVRRISNRALFWVIGLLAMPLATALYKVTGLPGSTAVSQLLSFERVPSEMLSRIHHLLFAPVGALLVVVFRLTLGIRVLGPFRSVLLAIAFQVTGIIVGVTFFALVTGVVVWLRPVFKRMHLPYFGRSAAMLAAVAAVIALAMLLGLSLGITSVQRVAYFPIVVLTLTGEAVATTSRREGARSAIWRATATAGVAVLIAALASIRYFQDSLVRFPELVLAVLAIIILVCEHLKLRLFQHLNPPVVKKRKSKKARSVGAGVPDTANLDTIPGCAAPLSEAELNAVVRMSNPDVTAIPHEACRVAARSE